jgi:hypothetical protein
VPAAFNSSGVAGWSLVMDGSLEAVSVRRENMAGLMVGQRGTGF